jgi:hypothetical protein
VSICRREEPAGFGRLFERCGAIVLDDHADARPVLDYLARQQAARGYRVLGLIRRPAGEFLHRSTGVILYGLAGDETLFVSRHPGEAEAKEVLGRTLRRSIDLLVVSEFGAMEAEGEGFAGGIVLAARSGVPALTAVRERHRGRWLDFTGDAGACLAPHREAVSLWWRRIRGLGC